MQPDEAKPYSKEAQLARGARRYRRKVASPRQWQAIIAAKQGPCRVCVDAAANGFDFGLIELHHLVPRAQGGDDVADNIVPIHRICHRLITLGDKHALKMLSKSLTEAERAYMLRKVGP